MIAKIHILFEQCLRELRNRSFFSTTDFIQGLLYYNYIQGLAKYSLVWGVFSPLPPLSQVTVGPYGLPAGTQALLLPTSVKALKQ